MNKKTMKPIKSFYEDRGCFGCGADNRHGLRMTFQSNGEMVVLRLAVPEHLSNEVLCAA